MSNQAAQTVEQLACGIADKDGRVSGAWLDAYLDLLAAGLHWKKAAFVAWYNAPKTTRQPPTMAALAEALNYKSENVFYKWQKQDWFLTLGIENYRRSIFGKYLADVDRVTIGAAMNETGSSGVAARRLFYEMAGYGKSGVTVDTDNTPAKITLEWGDNTRE